MPKVELTKIRLAVTAISKQICATIPNKAGNMMLQKHDVSSDFFKCIVDYGKNARFNIETEDKSDESFQVIVKETCGFKRAVFSRQEVIDLFKKAKKEGVGKKISLEDWIEEKLL